MNTKEKKITTKKTKKKNKEKKSIRKETTREEKPVMKDEHRKTIFLF